MLIAEKNKSHVSLIEETCIPLLYQIKKDMNSHEKQLNETLALGQFYRNGNGYTFEVVHLDETSIGLTNLEAAEGKQIAMSRAIFCQLWSRRNYEYIKNPKASREYELTRTLGLNRLSVK
jgi:hypothetical protein